MNSVSEEKRYLAKCCMLDILSEVDRICQKNNIKYTLSNGTLIGAIKYNGFIPWDDDIDVAFLREDYDKFISCCKKELGNEFRLVNAENEDGNPNIYHKIKIKNTLYIEGISANSKINKEIFLDVFPYDKTSSNYCVGYLNQMRIDFYRRILAYKCGVVFPKNKNIFKRMANSFLIIVCKYYKKEKLIEKINRLMKKYENSNSKYVINAVGTYSFNKERMKRDYFEKHVRVDFEGKKYCVSKKYDEILKTMYGNYSQDPPESEKTSRHRISAIDIGGYKIKTYIPRKG